MAKDEAEAISGFAKPPSRMRLTLKICLAFYYLGNGVPKDYVEAYKWTLLAAAQGDGEAKQGAAQMENQMSHEQIVEGQKMARNFKPREVPSPGSRASNESPTRTQPTLSGPGFFITEDGYLITNEHVAGHRSQLRIVTEAGLTTVKVIK